jgi:hypothetical protein
LEEVDGTVPALLTLMIASNVWDVGHSKVLRGWYICSPAQKLVVVVVYILGRLLIFLVLDILCEEPSREVQYNREYLEGHGGSQAPTT